MGSEMKYVQINSRGDVWADSIIFEKHRELIAEGQDSWVFWARGQHAQDDRMKKIGSPIGVCIDALQTRIDGRSGFHSRFMTKKLLEELDAIDPDIVHLHVLTGYYLNVELLFRWLVAHRCKVIWTLHDCWAFTGHCIYFTKANCMQWKTGCACDGNKCPQKMEYPETNAGDSSVNWSFEKKKELFTMLPPERMELITPSQWLADLVGESFLSKYPISVKRNQVNTDIFKPTPSDFRERYGLEDKFVVLGVASKWSPRKGLSDFVDLSHKLSDSFSIVLIGLTEKQCKVLPDNIVKLTKTKTLTELAEAYTAADLYLTLSMEETFGMTVAEATACGTPVAVVDGTACLESSMGAKRYIIDSDLSNLEETILDARNERKKV